MGDAKRIKSSYLGFSFLINTSSDRVEMVISCTSGGTWVPLLDIQQARELAAALTRAADAAEGGKS